MTREKVLLVSEDREAGEVLVFSLRRHGLEVMLLDNSQQAIEQWRTNAHILAILNECGDSLNGVTLCEGLRRKSMQPILLLTHDRDERYILKAYQAGVDECIGKPIGIRLLMAKIMTWLHRAGSMPTDSRSDVAVGGLRLMIAQRQMVLNSGEAIKLTNLELRLLHLLMSHPGLVMEPAVIVKYVWGYQDGHGTALLKHVIYRLRRKIEPDPAHPTYVQTEAGKGYFFCLES